MTGTRLGRAGGQAGDQTAMLAAEAAPRPCVLLGYGGLRWITVGPPGQPGTSIVLQPPTPPGCGATEDERRTIAEMMAKGSYACITLATKDLDGAFERLEASGAEVVQEPTEQPYGIRDCAFRDPAGTLIRISEVP